MPDNGKASIFLMMEDNPRVEVAARYCSTVHITYFNISKRLQYGQDFAYTFRKGT